MPKAGKYKWLSSLRVLVTMQVFTLSPIYIYIYIQINNKTIIEFSSRRI